MWYLFVFFLFLSLLPLVIYYKNPKAILESIRLFHILISILLPKAKGSAEIRRGNRLLITYELEGQQRQVFLKYGSERAKWTKVYEKDIDGVEDEVTQDIIKFCDPHGGFFAGTTPKLLGYETLIFHYPDSANLEYTENMELKGL